MVLSLNSTCHRKFYRANPFSCWMHIYRASPFSYWMYHHRAKPFSCWMWHQHRASPFSYWMYHHRAIPFSYWMYNHRSSPFSYWMYQLHLYLTMGGTNPTTMSKRHIDSSLPLGRNLYLENTKLLPEVLKLHSG